MNEDRGLGKITWRNYIPLIVIVGIIFLTSILIGFRDASVFSPGTIENFMIGFFLVFGGFKLFDLKGFANGYSTYDLLAQKLYGYGYAYPFIELFFGFAMILYPLYTPILVAELALMTFSGVGVAAKIAKREELKCVCLGTTLKVPLTTVTLLEDFGMAFLALVLLVI